MNLLTEPALVRQSRRQPGGVLRFAIQAAGVAPRVRMNNVHDSLRPAVTPVTDLFAFGDVAAETWLGRFPSRDTAG